MRARGWARAGNRGRPLAVGALGVLLAACTGSAGRAPDARPPALDAAASPALDAAGAAPDQSVARDTAEDAPRPGDAAPAPFGPGVYYRRPNLDDPTALLTRVSPPLDLAVVMPPVGFDLRGDVVVFPYPAGLVVANPAGQRREVRVSGLYGVVRPSLSPDGRRAAVQASATPAMPPEDLDIFVVSLSDGSFRRVGNLPFNEESPAFFPRSNRIAYSSFSPTVGVDLHVYDLDQEKEVLVIKGGGALHIAVSPDEKRILDLWRLRAYDAATGAVVLDLRADLDAALPATGYAADTAHPGRGGRTSFVLGGAFSPDGLSLVLDGAVTREGKFGAVVFTTPLSPVALTAVTPLIPLNDAFTNDNNFSQLYPTWR